MIEYFVPLCVLIFVIVVLVFTFIIIKGIITDWEFFKPFLISVVQGILLSIGMILFMIGGINAPFYIPKLFG
jgi:hypothetical protein